MDKTGGVWHKSVEQIFPVCQVKKRERNLYFGVSLVFIPHILCGEK